MKYGTVALGEVCSFVRGVTFGADDATTSKLPGYVPILRAGNIGEVLDTDDDLVWVPGARVSIGQRMRIGDIAICMSSGSSDVVGKTAQLRSSFDGSVGAFCGIIRANKLDHADYIGHWLRSPSFLSWRDQQAKGANIQNLRFSELASISIQWPPLPEQQRIAAILERADRLRRLRRYALELSEGYLQAVFVEMFGDPVRNPKGWVAKTLAQLRAKFAYGTSAKCFSEPQGLPVLRIPNVLSREICLDDLKYAQLDSREVNTLALRRGDLLFVRTNGNPDYVGRCAVFDLEEKFLFASYLIRARFDAEVIDPWYLDTFLRTQGGRRAMGPYIRTTAGQSNIGMEGLGQIAVPVPPRVLQQRFAAVVSRHSRLQIQQREAARQAEQLFGALLDRAFRGEL